MHHQVYKDTDNQGGCGGGDDHEFIEVQGETADTRDKDRGDDKQISRIFKVDLLNHFKARYRNKAVKRQTNTANDTSGQAVDKGNERREEGKQ